MISGARFCGISILLLIAAAFLIPPAFLYRIIEEGPSSALRPGSVRTLVSTLPTMGEEEAIEVVELGFDDRVEQLTDNIASPEALETIGLVVDVEDQDLGLVLRNVNGIIEFSDLLEDRLFAWIIAPSADKESFPIQFNLEGPTMSIFGQLADRNDIAVYLVIPATLEKLDLDFRVSDVELTGDRVSGLEELKAVFSGSRIFAHLPGLEAANFSLKGVTSRVDLRAETLLVEETFDLDTTGGTINLDTKAFRNGGGVTQSNLVSTVGIISARLGKHPVIRLDPKPSLGEIWVNKRPNPDVLGEIELHATSRLASITVD